ncbi:hypothetical protein [Rossellomorea sp. BNER]|uniref:hypothetical protein n=1 Tax=Rossellomorea sp. BNER TaxID=2962031 RepID=UPI003AF2A193|nr:hypothetical protein [Rossellomorea sp. BNER]
MKETTIIGQYIITTETVTNLSLLEYMVKNDPQLAQGELIIRYPDREEKVNIIAFEQAEYCAVDKNGFEVDQDQEVTPEELERLGLIRA